MNRRDFLKGTSLMATSLALPHVALGAPPRRPNVILILTDDQGWGDLRCHGNDRLDTPVLDRLAASGASFERFYVCPLCAPTRASVLTGRYHLRTGVTGVTHGLETMRLNEVTLADALRAGGYATGCFGKWHNGAHYPYHPNGRGFDEFLGFCAGHWNNYFDTALQHNQEPVRTRGYITDVITDAALGFIEAHRTRPFFCYLPYNAPHSPFQVPDGYFGKYKALGLDDTTACVHGMVENLDDNVGRVLAKLDELELARDTIVLFATDNGPNSQRYNGGMRGAKGSVHEGGVRAPLFVRWPGRIAPGTVVRPIAAHVDLLPTLMDLCGVPALDGPPVDGVSLRPLLGGGAAGWPARRIFSNQSRGPNPGPAPGAVRDGRFVFTLEPRGTGLYDLAADPEQKRDVSAEHPEVVKELSAAYQEWFADVTRDGFSRLPVPVGHAQAPVVELEPPEARLEGGLAFYGGQGWANDWISHWESTEGSAAWDLDVVRPGRYDVTLHYTCPAADVGTRVRVEAGRQAVEGAVADVHDPAPLPSPDRVPRKEVYEKEWAPLTLGALSLEKGLTTLRVRALTKPGAAVMDVKGMHLRRVE